MHVQQTWEKIPLIKPSPYKKFLSYRQTDMRQPGDCVGSCAWQHGKFP